MIPLAVPNLDGNEARLLAECIESTFVSSVGPFVTRFEELVAETAGAESAVATSSGTTGLHLALVGLGVGPGDLVVLPSFTFIASANAIAHCGATPWLVDIDRGSWTLDAHLLEEMFRSDTVTRNGQCVHKESGRRVAAIMPVHTLGVPADMDLLRTVAKVFGIPVIADGAPALGALYKGRKLGPEADLTVFSFNGNKTVTAGAGGMIVGDDPVLMRTLRHLGSTARVGTEYLHDAVGYNYRMTNLQAAVGCAQMGKLSSFLSAKKRIAQTYRDALADITGLGFFPSSPWGESACWLSGLLLSGKENQTVASVSAALRDNQIESRPFWRPIHLQPVYSSAPRTSQHVSESIWDRILTLPCSTGLLYEDQGKVIEVLRRALRRA